VSKIEPYQIHFRWRGSHWSYQVVDESGTILMGVGRLSIPCDVSSEQLSDELQRIQPWVPDLPMVVGRWFRKLGDDVSSQNDEDT
jgi:hypothetical protein